MGRRIAGLLLTLWLCLESTTAASQQQRWIGSWGTALYSAGPAVRMSDVTLRQFAHVSIGGRQLRLRLSNEFGTAPLRIGGVRVALAAEGGAIKPGSERTLLPAGPFEVKVSER